MKKLLLLVIISLLLIQTATARQTIQVVEIPSKYLPTAERNVIYERYITIEPPDGLSDIVYAVIYIKGDFKANTKIYAELEGMICEPEFWEIDGLDVFDYMLIFDCSNTINNIMDKLIDGKLKFSFWVSKRAYNIFSYVKFTYKKSDIQASIFGTEYQPNDNATIFLQLLRDSQPLENATCLLDLFYPNKQKWLDDAVMMYLNNSEGIYYYDLIIPDQLGVYMLSIKCFYIVDYTKDYADNSIILEGLESGSYEDTWKDDNVFHTVTEKLVAGGYIFDFYYEFYNVSIPDNVTGMGIYWIGRWDDATEDVEIHVWDYCINNWSSALPNLISTNTPMVSNFIEADNLSCYVQNGTVKVEFHDHIPNEKVEAGTFDTDFVEVQLYYLTYGQINDIRGSGELHISSIQRNMEDFILSMQDVLDPVETYCENNTMVVKRTRIYSINNRQLNITDEERINCTYGCSNNRCVIFPHESLILILIIIFIIFIIYYLGFKRHVD